MRKANTLLLLCILTSCELLRNNPDLDSVLPEYMDIPQVYPLPNFVVDEASGICDSKNMEGKVWINEDSDNPNEIHLLTHQGIYEGKIALPFPNRDWEDMAIGKSVKDGKNYVHIADIGDNSSLFDEYYIYRFQEPGSINESITDFEKIAFKYPDGSRDAEAILLDPHTNDIYIVTKREEKVRLYKLTYPQSVTDTQTAKFIKEIDYQWITSGEISANGKEIVIRSYLSMYYWYRKSNETIEDIFSRKADRDMPYIREIQEEGFCFEKNGKGFFSVGERNKDNFNLYYYKKK